MPKMLMSMRHAKKPCHFGLDFSELLKGAKREAMRCPRLPECGPELGVVGRADGHLNAAAAHADGQQDLDVDVDVDESSGQLRGRARDVVTFRHFEIGLDLGVVRGG